MKHITIGATKKQIDVQQLISKRKGKEKMFSRCFERESFNRNDYTEIYEVINLNCYCFDWYVNNELVKEGLVDNLEETIEMLIEEGFEEVK